MDIIYAEYNINRNSIDIATTTGHLFRIDCWEAEKGLKTTPCSECALNTLIIDEPLEYARLSLWVICRCVTHKENWSELSTAAQRRFDV